MPLLYGLILIVAIAAVYGFSMSENRNTPLPEGCSEILAQCGSCHDVTCGHYDTNRKGDN